MAAPSDLLALLERHRSWLSGAAQGLALPKWREAERVGISPENYGSERWLLGRADAPRAGARLTVAPDWTPFLERPGAAVLGSTEGLNLGFEHAEPGTALEALTAADDVLRAAPELRDAVHALTLVVHPLAAEPGYDLSRSDPALPFSIFASLPAGEPDAAQRLAESLLHEAMHLQLTLIDESRPLTRDADATAHSPWQRRERPLLGVLHGLYVFVAIERLHRAVLDGGNLALVGHATRRLAEIANEVEQVRGIRHAPALTPAGRALADALLRDHAALAAAKSIAIEL